MSKLIDTIAGADTPAFFAEQSRELLAHCGCLVVKTLEDRVKCKGTGTFVHSGAKQFIFTANHVLEALEAAPDDARLLLPPLAGNREALIGQSAPSSELKLPLDIIWRSKECDAAVIDASFVPGDRIRWFDLSAAIKKTQKISVVWRDFADDESSLPFAIAGYAEWGHIRDFNARVEVVSALPLFAYVTEWDDGAGAKAPQIYAEIVAGGRSAEELAVLSDLHRAMAAKMETDESPLGGYSGGPLVLFAQDGIHLVGVIKEGGFTFGMARAFCSPIDVVAQLAGLA